MVAEDMCIGLLDKYGEEKKALHCELKELGKYLDASAQIRSLKKYAEFEVITRKMAFGLIEYIIVDECFYTDPENPKDGENFYSLLHDMQLIVIPITSNFLERDCLARSGVFAYAMEQHIPVFPILEKNGIEDKFNGICGDLQILNPYERDLTAVPFEKKKKKMSKYLSSVLIGDELAEKIRNTFDTYIFMSYRQKDRKEAQKLMKIIHENLFCRDIAIWYDEYLVPGENFNQAIQKAMQKSDVLLKKSRHKNKKIVTIRLKNA